MSKEQRPVILAVDDFRENLVYLIRILGEAKYDVVVAENGRKALDLVEREGVRPDLFLLDIMMPEMDGITLCRRLREVPLFIDIPIIFVTAKEGTDDVIAGFEAGAQDYVTKPFHGRELLARIRTQLDLSHNVRENKRLRQHLELHVQNTPLAVIEWDADCRIVQWNRAAERIFGYTRAEALGQPGQELIAAERDDLEGDCGCEEMLRRRQGCHRRMENRDRLGRTIYCEWYNTPLVDGQGQVVGVASLVADITEQQRAEQALRDAKEEAEWLARIDPLTEMNNRRSFFELADAELKLALRHARSIAVVMIDIDHFKRVNDEHSHLAGDEALKFVAGLIHHSLRQSDIVGRMGGEEFALVLPETTVEGALTMVERLRERIEEIPVETREASLHLTISAGISGLQPGDRDVSNILSRADHALYAAKELGRNRVVVDGEPG